MFALEHFCCKVFVCVDLVADKLPIIYSSDLELRTYRVSIATRRDGGTKKRHTFGIRILFTVSCIQMQVRRSLVTTFIVALLKMSSCF